jgi:hypothetical protein
VLLLLTGVSLWSAFLGLGVYTPIVQYGVAATQAAIIFILFMRLKGPRSPLKWLFAASASSGCCFFTGSA